uniref:Uncharacterized protein n=1 Tax=Parascaris equorum TaxID=6256 RepID=A0A914RZT1_PAREQ
MKIALKHANEANEEARGNIMHYDKQISELQQILHEEGTKREHWRQQYIVSEKKLTTMKANKEELIEKEIQVRNVYLIKNNSAPIIQNSKKQSENEIREVNEHNDQLAANGTEMSLLMRKLDAELVILKLEQRLNTVNAETEREKRRHQDVLKNIAKYDRKARGLEFEEEMAAANLQKYKRIQAELERAEDRAENAENSLLKVSSNKSNEHFDE